MKVSDAIDRGMVERVADILDLDIAISSSTHPTIGQVESWLRDGFVAAAQALTDDVLLDLVTVAGGSSIISTVSVETLESAQAYTTPEDTVTLDVISSKDGSLPSGSEFLRVLSIFETPVGQPNMKTIYNEVRSISDYATKFTSSHGYWERSRDGNIVLKVGTALSRAAVFVSRLIIPDFTISTVEIPERIANSCVLYAVAMAQLQDEDEQSSAVSLQRFYQILNISNKEYNKDNEEFQH